MDSVTIGANSYDVYAGLDVADVYLAADPNAAVFIAGTDDQRGQWLVSATRILNRQYWLGEKTDGTDQVDAWPRTGTGVDGVDEDTIPQDIIDACCELASAIANGTDWSNTQSTANNQKRLKAGSVEVEYFRPGDPSLPLPLSVWALIAKYMGGAGTTTGSLANGTCQDNPLECGFGFGQPI
jgi:hypothetical protein